MQLPSHMIAGVYQRTREVSVESITRPQAQPGEAVVRVESCGICPSDLKKIDAGLLPPPRIFGHEIAGTIVELGSGVAGWSIGDRVALFHHVPCRACYYCERRAFAQCDTYKRVGTTAGYEPAGGGFAEYVKVMDWVVANGMIRLPDTLSFHRASFLEPLNTCLKCIATAQIQPGDTVLILGQGTVGLILDQLARRAGAQLIVADPLLGRLSRAATLDVQTCLTAEEHHVVRAARNNTNERGADVTIVAAPGETAIRTALRATRPAGRVVCFAQTVADESLPVEIGQVGALEKTLAGSYSADITLVDDAIQLLLDPQLQLEQLITHTFTVRALPEAIQVASQPGDTTLKVMISREEVESCAT